MDRTELDFVGMTADIVSAYVTNNSVTPADLPKLIADVHAGLVRVETGAAVSAEPEVPILTPAQIRKSVRPEGIVSFLDGKVYRTLKRHLSGHGHTPESYRVRYGLPPDYPMVSARYSEQRSELARGFGLGRRAAAPPAADPADGDAKVAA